MDEHKYEVFWYFIFDIFHNFQFIIMQEAI